MEERSLRITGTDKTIFTKLTSKLTKMLIPTQIGINGMFITMKRNAMLKAYENFSKTEEYDKKNLEEKYNKAYEAYLEILDKHVMENVYKKVRSDMATIFEKNALAKYYEVISLRESEFIEYKNRKQKYLLELDYEGLKISPKQQLVEKYKEFYVSKMDGIFKAVLKNYSIKIADSTNVYDTSKEKVYGKIFETIEDYIQNVLSIKIEQGTSETCDNVLQEYEKFQEYTIGKLDVKDNIEKNTVLLGISRKLFTHSLPLIVASQCYEKLLKDARSLVQDTKIAVKREKVYGMLLFIMEDYYVKLLSTKVYWEDLEKRDQFKKLWDRYNEISSTKDENYVEYLRQKEILFIKDDIKNIEKEKYDYSKIIKYYKRKLIDYGELRVFKDKVKSIGNYKKIKKAVAVAE